MDQTSAYKMHTEARGQDLAETIAHGVFQGCGWVQGGTGPRQGPGQLILLQLWRIWALHV